MSTDLSPFVEALAEDLPILIQHVSRILIFSRISSILFGVAILILIFLAVLHMSHFALTRISKLSAPELEADAKCNSEMPEKELEKELEKALKKKEVKKAQVQDLFFSGKLNSLLDFKTQRFKKGKYENRSIDEVPFSYLKYLECHGYFKKREH